MSHNAQITARQLWGRLSTPGATQTASSAWCTPLILPSGGVLVFDGDQTSTLSAQVTFKLPCHNPDSIISPDTTGNSSVIGFQDPFYASISPQVFALATATVISYVLVILIFITPRTFFMGGPGGGARLLGRRGPIPGTYGSSSIVGVGRRPLLQKIATITVAVSLTIATADTFSVAEDQYNQGYMDSTLLVDSVVGSLEIRIIRVISETFLWLAQVQTLIRLFPRHKEKVTIKWLGFAMVSSDTIFSILDSFVGGHSRTRPRSFQDAIPALNYLFELAISLIYASCVVYYCLSKRRFAFWHPKMKNICLVALLSLLSVVIPVVFFVLDISQPNLAGWGEYIRWVGAAAASVVVWEWVERIESLERDEKKDGILGREIFDGDEMLNMTPSDDTSWHGHDRGTTKDGGLRKTMGEGVAARYRRLRSRVPFRKRRKMAPQDGISTGADAMDSAGPRMMTRNNLVMPEPVMTPPDRSASGSVASTVYAIRYHNPTSPSPNLQRDGRPEQATEAVLQIPKDDLSENSSSAPPLSATEKEMAVQPRASVTNEALGRPKWHSVTHPFKRRRAEPPAEVVDAQIASGIRRSPIDSNLNLRGRLGAFASAQKERFARRGSVPATALPVTLIPAPKGSERTWSPDDLRNGLDIEGAIPKNTIAPATQQTSAAAQRETSDTLQVVHIPAPTPGRTWSPDDLPQAEGSVSRPTDPSLEQSRPVGMSPAAPDTLCRNVGGGAPAREANSSLGGNAAYSVPQPPTAHLSDSNTAPTASDATVQSAGEHPSGSDLSHGEATTSALAVPQKGAGAEAADEGRFNAEAEVKCTTAPPSPGVSTEAAHETAETGHVVQSSAASGDARDTGGT
ncbi:pH-response regulator protein palH/RIM21 [Exophiala dermatitidis]